MGNESRLIRARQVDWAGSAQLDVENGYCHESTANLFRLTPTIRAELEGGDGNEFRDSAETGRRAKIAALHSSSALAVNGFGYWHERPDPRLTRVFGVEKDVARIQFERKFRTGVGPKSPNMDVTMTLADGSLLAIESKFLESYSGSGKKVIQDKYFPPGRSLWTDAGLPGAQQAAERFRDGERFRWLDVPQLLKHMLGLASQPRPWDLILLWYAVPGEVSDAMHQEIGYFKAMLGSDSRHFSAKTWQEFWHSLAPMLGDEHAAYRDYIGRRYFQDAQGQLATGI